MRIDNKKKILIGAEYIPSPNFNERPSCIEIDLLVIHNISLPSGIFDAALITALFCNQLDLQSHAEFASLKNLKVSAHLLIQRDGKIIQYVAFDKRAWHAGSSNFQGRDNCNDFSIGIEILGTDDFPYTDMQYQALSQVTALLLQTYPQMNLSRLVGHCDIAPQRKTDPGPAFDWHHYRKLTSLLLNKSN